MHDGLSHHRFNTFKHSKLIPFRKWLVYQSSFHLKHHAIDKNGMLDKKGAPPYGFFFAQQEVHPSRSKELSLFYIALTFVQVYIMYKM
jgi:hypothetical protein